MPSVMFLAAAYDPRPGKEGTVYGPGHITTFDETDYDYVIELRKRGMAAIIDPTGLPDPPLPGLAAPAGYVAPA
jgi:hypothetical protein